MILIWIFIIILLFYILDKWISTKEDFKKKKKKSSSGGGGGGSSLPSTAIATIMSMIALGAAIVIALIGLYTNSPLSTIFVEAFLAAAFVPKTVQKFTETKPSE